MAQTHDARKARRRAAAVKIKPSAFELLRQGNLLRRAGELVRAEELYRQAIRLDTGCTDAWAELGCCLLENTQHVAEAVTCFQRVLNISSEEITPDNLVHHEGIRLLAKIVAGRPDWITGQLALGCAYGLAGQHEPARTHLGNVLQLDPSLEAPVQSMFAAMHYKEQNCLEAIASADRALAAGADSLAIRLVHSRSCFTLGRMREGIASARRAIEIAPSPDFHSTLLFAMSFLEDATPESLYMEAFRWNSLYAAPLARRIRPHPNDPDPERRIKVGYVSPDLHNHAVMKFVPQVFEHHDTSGFDVVVYAVGSRSDHMTEDLRKSIENYLAIPVAGHELAERVRADGVDILVDLAGHTMGPAFLAFAEKPAPIQVSWIGMLSTTGLTTIDYFLGDAHLPCPGTEPLFSESVYRLPVICSYRPFENVPVAPAPCLERGYITFGSFNNLRKITRDVVKLWSAILHLVSESRLLLKYHGMEQPVMRGNLESWFAEDGIPPERLQFEGAAPPREYLEAFGKIDIALDPFPYNGGSTTLDTLWMGVPVVTLAGRTSVQRTGASLLSAAGFGDLVTHTPEEYLKATLFLAESVPKMPDLRVNVRQALQSSPLMDEVGLVRNVEQAYREMWRTWCQTRN
ncbi:MAG TPA: tetratricopeptide repeat protein [Bryobacteraceae bacterium]|jgi:tetratricopeptide (TPR) repeat protein|nr:tetratricopeptide repeat protein [Bryobacteraceae bacterium]